MRVREATFEVLDASQDVATMPGQQANYVQPMWNVRLARPVRLEDGRTINTLSDAREIILGLPDEDQRRPQWQAVAGLLLSAASAGCPDLLAIANGRLEVMLPRLAHTPTKPLAQSVRRINRLSIKKRLVSKTDVWLKRGR
jgi:hypothetical protein